MIDLADSQQWDTPVFPLSVAAQAARVELGAMRMWFARKKVTLQEHDFPGSTEAPARLLTWRSVLTLAATADLSRGSGIDVGLAYAQARHWTTIGWREKLGRRWFEASPAGLFPGSGILTVLIHWGDEFAKVVPIDGTDPDNLVGLSRDLLFPTRAPVRAAPRLLDVNAVHAYALGVCEGFMREDAA